MMNSISNLLGMGAMGVVPVVILGAVLFVMGYAIVQALKQKRANDASPRLTVDAFVAAKRTQVSTSQQPVGGDVTGAHGFYTTSATSYYVTFEVESGDRIEFEVSGTEYGRLAEGDAGRLSFQGTRYLGFERIV